MPIYLIIILATPLFPILLSFDKKVRYVSSWKWAILGAVIVAIPFIIWDAFFTQAGVWGFNERYLIGIDLFSLPIEEMSFFIVVPFACTFIYQCVRYYFKNRKLRIINLGFYFFLLIFCFLVAVTGVWGWYTTSAICLGLAVMGYLILKKEKYQFIPITFLFSLIPFMMVNGILTGSFLDEPIVWYNSEQFSELRLFTIPFEDVVYGWSLIALNIIVFERFRKST